jgi:hypothetical protein
VNASGGRLLKSCQANDQRRLARAIRSNQPKNYASAQLQIDVRNCGKPLEFDEEIGDAEFGGLRLREGEGTRTEKVAQRTAPPK